MVSTPIHHRGFFIWVKTMLVYQHEPLLLNNLYEYQRIKYACPMIFQPSETDPDLYDIILKDGQNLPITNILPRSWDNEPGVKTTDQLLMGVEFVTEDEYGEALEITVTLNSTPVENVELRMYYAGTSKMILPIYFTNALGQATVYLEKGIYDIWLRVMIEDEPADPAPPCGLPCKPTNPYKNFSRMIPNVELEFGIIEYDSITTDERVPVTRFVRRMHTGSNAMKQGNIYEQVRFSSAQEFEPNVFYGGLTRVFDTDGKLVQVIPIDTEGKVTAWLEKYKTYIFYHDQKDFNTVYEVVDTSSTLMGREDVVVE